MPLCITTTHCDTFRQPLSCELLASPALLPKHHELIANPIRITDLQARIRAAKQQKKTTGITPRIRQHGMPDQQRRITMMTTPENLTSARRKYMTALSDSANRTSVKVTVEPRRLLQRQGRKRSPYKSITTQVHDPMACAVPFQITGEINVKVLNLAILSTLFVAGSSTAADTATTQKGSKLLHD